MGGMRKIVAIPVADIVRYSRLAGTDEDRTLSRPRGLRTDLTPQSTRIMRASSSARATATSLSSAA
jgi:hypothetical protein